MILSKKIMDELIDKLKIPIKKIVENDVLNVYGNYWLILDEQEEQIFSHLKTTLEIVLYSKYYWCTKYKELYNKFYGYDAGLEDQQSKISQEIYLRLDDKTDYIFLEKIYNGQV